MYGDLQHVTDDELLNYVMLILARNEASLSAFSLTELSQVEEEFMRRGTLCGEEYEDLTDKHQAAVSNLKRIVKEIEDDFHDSL